MLFEVERTTLSGQPVLRVVGDLDLTSAARLTEAVDAELVVQPLVVYVDLGSTTFMDSSGARALTRVARKASVENVPLRVVCPHTNRSVRLVIDLLELESVVPVVDALPRPATGVVRGEDGP